MKKWILLFCCLLACWSLCAQSQGYFNLTQLSFLMADEDESSPVKSSLAPSLVNINGYRFNEHVSLGLGVGMTSMSYLIFPVFADFRITFLKGDVSPVLALKGGYAFANSKKKIFNDYWGDFKNTGGGMINPEIGCKIKMTERADFMLTIGYWYQHIESEIKYNGYYQKHNRVSDLNRLSFSIGFLFR